MSPLPDDMTAPDVRDAFAAFAPGVRAGLLNLRRLILEVAAETEGAQPVEETTRWGQPAYIAPRGMTLRLGMPKSGGFALFVTCTTSLIEEFRAVAGASFRFEGTRAVLFDEGEEINEAALAVLIARALTYHRKAHRRR